MAAIRFTSGRESEILGVLDIGTYKTCCLIAGGRAEGGESDALATKLLGFGHLRSKGVRAGTITDLEAAETTIRAVVGQAERMAGVSLEQAALAVSCGRLGSVNFAARGPVASGVVSDDDIARIMAAGRGFAEQDGRRILHMNRVSCRLDSNPGLSEVRGLAGRELEIDLNAVTVDDGPLQNLLTALGRAYLSPADLVASPAASALAATTEDERRSGVMCIDLGAGTSTFAIYSGGALLHVGVVAVGGGHATTDLAASLCCRPVEAERIKVLYGSLVGGAASDLEVISYESIEEGAGIQRASKGDVRQILTARIHMILDLLCEPIAASGVFHAANGRIVLTGGASLLPGLGEAVANRFGAIVRLGRPILPSGAPGHLSGPAFSVSVGLLRLLSRSERVVGKPGQRDLPPGSYLSRVGRWLKESF